MPDPELTPEADDQSYLSASAHHEVLCPHCRTSLGVSLSSSVVLSTVLEDDDARP